MTPSTPLSRRGLLGLAGTAAAGSVLLDPAWFRSPQRLDATVPDDAWPMARRDPGRTGFAERGPTEDVGVAWAHELDDSFPGIGPPVVVADGTVFTATRCLVHALDAESGEPDWQYEFGSDGWLGGRAQFVQSRPVVDDEGVYVSAGVSLFSVTHGGGSRWQYETTSSFDRPLVAGNTAYFTSDLDDDTLLALDTATGLTRWRDAPATIRPEAYADGVVVGAAVEDSETTLGALFAQTGQTRWTRDLPVGDSTRLLPTVSDGTVFYGTGTLYALSLDDGSTQWRRDVSEEPRGLHTVVDDETVYTVAADAGRVVALDADTGETRWEHAVEALRATLSPAVTDDTLYVSAGPMVVALDTEDGSEQFRLRVPGSGAEFFALAAGTLYAGSGQTLVALREGAR
ncbi:Outer membrane protein assembly factor BamB, contains PQQ-like beta-propeller repeat [Halogranum amylolyticum]|uniref:Outer membrane protein assembly factor BamB, contains PQQ-like beta-propeller repeat n=1 Tax=Halogranum amylolyticum TaxID=660520 RepID=A0A1H8TTR0_9EURY|nr:PQQ-binding-like beta-propeller repeat protein [Halogranum amylolyticum]SEO94014.1 Outer membrane protein assembly factor BamB, contains PQQ-like beta-propeller repeat [Halogranum amylolyticum]